MGKRNYAICQSCGNKADYTECSQKCGMSKDARCAVLGGWLSLSHCEGAGAVEHYDCCSFSCLQKWVDSRLPKVPETFLKAFGEIKPIQ